jgi:sulfur-oxidizing protein SoxY
MTTDIRRRLFLKHLMVNSALASTFCAGLLKPKLALAIWPKSAFESNTVPEALNVLYGTNESIRQKRLTSITVSPHLDDGGVQVTVNLNTKIKEIDSITLLAPNNKKPLIASFKLYKKPVTSLQTRIVMETIGDLVAIIKSGDSLFYEATEVDFTGCGCG